MRAWTGGDPRGGSLSALSAGPMPGSMSAIAVLRFAASPHAAPQSGVTANSAAAPVTQLRPQATTACPNIPALSGRCARRPALWGAFTTRPSDGCGTTLPVGSDPFALNPPNRDSDSDQRRNGRVGAPPTLRAWCRSLAPPIARRCRQNSARRTAVLSPQRCEPVPGRGLMAFGTIFINLTFHAQTCE